MAINGIDEKILFQRHNPSKTPGRKGSINPYLTKPSDLLREDNAGVLVIDPNKVVDAYNEIKDRYIKQEDLAMYASLKVYKRANSSIVYNPTDGARKKDLSNDAIYVNFLNPITNIKRSDGFYVNKGKMTSEWTDFFTSDAANDKTSSDYILDPETFGITNINIKINANHHPIITMEFTDVQGRVLFERGNEKDNPYNIFYTYPYPKFSLRYKGYFGKAVETPLVLLRSHTRFDPSTGNYNITAEFQSDVFSIFNTFLVIYAYVAPYMFKVENGEYLGRKILKELYDTQNDELKQQLSADEYPKYEITKNPTLFELAGALTKIPFDALTSEASEDNELLLNNKITIENYEANIRDYFQNNPDVYSIPTDAEIGVAPGEDTIEVFYKAISDEGKIDITNSLPNSLFDQINLINEAITNISNISVRGQGAKFTENLKKDLAPLQSKYRNNKIEINEIIQGGLFLVEGKDNIISLDTFNKVIAQVIINIERIQAVIEDESINQQIKDLGTVLGYQPTLSNILRIISNNMQVFITMLDTMGKSANNQLKTDKLRLTTQQKFSDHKKEFNDSVYNAFPNYFKIEREIENDNEVVEKTVLAYPGSDSVNSNWFEVRFVEEIYEALNRIEAEANPPVNGIKQQTPTSLLSVFQLGENDLSVYKSKEYSRALGEMFARYSLYNSYSGLLYRGITNYPANVSSVIADFEIDLMVKNITTKLQSDRSRWIFGNDVAIATSAGEGFTNLGNFGIKFIGFSDKTVETSLSLLKPIYAELSNYTNGSYSEESYNKTLNKLEGLFNSPPRSNSANQLVGIRNKFVYDMIRFKKSENDVNLYSTTRDKKTTPLKHFVDLRPNDSYYSDNSELLKNLSNNFKTIDSQKSNKNSFQGLYNNMNDSLSKIPTYTDISRGVSYFNSDKPALTFNTDTIDYTQMGEFSPFNVVQKISTNNFHDIFNTI